MAVSVASVFVVVIAESRALTPAVCATLLRKFVRIPAWTDPTSARRARMMNLFMRLGEMSLL